MTVQCPRCGVSTGLWEEVEVPGWRLLGEDGRPNGGRVEVDRTDAEPTGMVGCGECEWEGPRSDLAVLGIDGRPLPRVHPRQETLA